MRLHQLRTLAWAVNAISVVVVAWTATTFLDAHEARAQPFHVAWPGDARTVRPVAEGVAWDMDRVRELLNVPLDGFVPAPPDIPVCPGPPTPSEAFAAATSVEAGVIHSNPHRSLVRIRHARTPYTVSPGRVVNGWQITRIALDPESGEIVAVFRHMESAGRERVELRSHVPKVPVLVSAQGLVEREPVALPADGPLMRFRARGELVYCAFEPEPNVWLLPDEELGWWVRWGADDVFGALDVNADSDDGLEIAGAVGAGTAVAAGRGLHKGETILAVDGVAPGSAADLASLVRSALTAEGSVSFRLRDVAGAERTLVWRSVRRP